MQSIKSYTDIEQSRRLAKIFAVETSDYYYPITYIEESTNKYLMSYIKPYIGRLSDIEDSVDTRLYIPCWSLTALLDVLPNGHSLGKRTNGKYYVCMTHIKHDIPEFDNPVDACVAMIEKLHKLNLL